MRFTQIPSSTFQKIQINAAMLLTSFDPTDGSFSASDQLGATTGGINFTATPTYADFGEDIDNCPNNTKELKRLTGWEAKASGSFVMVDTDVAISLLGAADLATGSTTHVMPRADLKSTDFDDLWIVGDYSEYNGDVNGGFVAIKLTNALSNGGFQIQTTKNGKGQFSFEYLAHYSISAISTVPFDIYIVSGTAEPSLGTMTVTSVAGSLVGDTTLSVSDYVQPAGYSYKYKAASGTAPAVAYNEVPDASWSSWDGVSDLTITSGYEVTVVSVDGTGKAKAAGSTTVVVK